MRILPLASCIIFVSSFVLAQPAGQGLSPCALVTKAEVQEAVGAAVSDGLANPTNKLVCDFKIGATGSSVSLLLTRKAAADSAEKTVSELQKRKIQASVVRGIGDGAYAASPGYGMQQLGAYKGSSHVVVTVFIMGTPEAKAKAVAEKVMKKALTHL
jgi:hypothetical protein